MNNKTHLRKNNRIRRFAASLLVCVIALLLASTQLVLPIGAAETTAKLTVHLAYVDDDTQTPISGAVFQIYQVGAFDEAGHYVRTEAFADANVADFASLTTASALSDAAEQFAAAAKNIEPDAAQKTDETGNAVFGDISAEQFGIYLVIQSGKTGDAAKYTTAAPFLIQVPEVTESGFGYDVIAAPKLVIETPPDTPPETPPKTPPETTPKTPTTPPPRVKTGDSTNIVLWVTVLCVCTVAVVVFVIFSRKRGNQNGAEAGQCRRK